METLTECFRVQHYLWLHYKIFFFYSKEVEVEVLTIAAFYHSRLTVCSRRSMNSHTVKNFCFVFAKNLAVNPFGLGLILSNIGHTFTKLMFSSIFISSAACKFQIHDSMLSKRS